jgi:hypothetical protein
VTRSGRWWFVSDLHLTPGAPDARGTLAAFTDFLDDVLLRAASEQDHLVLLGDTVELGRGRGPATASPVTLLCGAAAESHGLVAALHRVAGNGVSIHLVCGNHDYPLMDPQCRRAVRTLSDGGAHGGGVQVHPWILYRPGLLYAEHGHQHHALNRLPALLTGQRLPDGERLPATVLESWDHSRGRSAVRRAVALAAAVQDARRAERASGAAEYAALLAENCAELDQSTVQALHRISRFSVLPAAMRTAHRVAGRRTGVADPNGYLRAAASDIDRVLSDAGPAPLCYVFGHTHHEALEPLASGPGWYANTGTWSNDTRHRGAKHLFPFIEIREAGSGSAAVALAYWDHDRRRVLRRSCCYPAGDSATLRP